MNVIRDTAVLGPGSFLTGKVVGGNVVILGGFEGDLTVAGRLSLGPESRVRAVVRADVVEIEGDFEGELHANALRLMQRARATGVFNAARLTVDEGAIFEGAVNVPAVAEEPKGLVEAPAPVLALVPVVPDALEAEAPMTAPAELDTSSVSI